MAKLVGRANITTETTTTHFRIEGSGFEFFVIKHIDKYIDHEDPMNHKHLVAVKVDWYLGDLMLQMTDFPNGKREYRYRKDGRTNGQWNTERIQQADLQQLLQAEDRHLMRQSFKELKEWCAENPQASGLVTDWALRVLRDAGVKDIR